MKKKIMMSMSLLSLMLLACGGSDDENVISDNNKEPGWELVWQDEFDGETVDESVWSRITEGTPDWKKYQSTDDRCYEKRGSSIVFYGIVNDDKDADPRDYLCGGLYTAGKKDRKSVV